MGKLDIGKSNPFGSYPLIQPLAEPSLSEPPIRLFVLIGSALGSLFVTAGVVSLWLHERKNSMHEQVESLQSEVRSHNSNY